MKLKANAKWPTSIIQNHMLNILDDNINYLPLEEIKYIALSLYNSTEKKDFEFYYIVAEVFAKIGLCDLAVEASILSLNGDIERDYLYVKHAKILQQCSSASTALKFLSKLQGTKNETELVKNFTKRLKQVT